MVMPIFDLVNHYNPQAQDQSDRLEGIIEASAPGTVFQYFGALQFKINKAFKRGDPYVFTYPGVSPDPQSLNFYYGIVVKDNTWASLDGTTKNYFHQMTSDAQTICEALSCTDPRVETVELSELKDKTKANLTYRVDKF